MLGCSICVTAYNEAANIGQLMERLGSQELETVRIDEIILVASGCTDETVPIAQKIADNDLRIRILTQPEREGKASAINYYLRETKHDICVLCSGDLLPEVNAVEQLVSPLADKEVGMTSCRPVPVNDETTFMGFAAHMLWDLHHHMNLQAFKAGEMTAFRRIFQRIPNHTAVDEASVEPVIRGQGYRVQYVPTAIVYNKGPETVGDFIKQRRRIYAGHLDLQKLVGYSVSTMGGLNILKLVLKNLDKRPKQFIWTWCVAGLEVVGRMLGKRDYQQRRSHTVWDIAESTKELNNA